MKSRLSRRYLLGGFGAGTAVVLLIFVRTPLFRGEGLARLKSSPSAHRIAPELTKDDVLRVGDHTLSIAGYSNFRTTMSERSRDEVIWIAKCSLLLLDYPTHPSLQTATEVARYAEGHFPRASAEKSLHAFLGESVPLPSAEELHGQLETRLTHAVVLVNPRIVSELR
ncbi:MAG: hypothetical protein ACXWPM_07035 [Bdellovibrionota bacterium]